MEDSSISTLKYLLKFRCWLLRILFYFKLKSGIYSCQLILKNGNCKGLNEFLSCLSNKAQIEIHCEGKIFFWEYLDHRHSDNITNLRLKLLMVKKNEEELSLHDVSLPIKLLDVSEPYVIKEDGWDLIWFSFDGGHMVFYFKKPEGVL